VSTKILLDCDPGHDDAIALLLALASPELELLGVTTVAGNQTLEKTTANAIRVLELAGRGDVPVAAGSRRWLRSKWLTAAASTCTSSCPFAASGSGTSSSRSTSGPPPSRITIARMTPPLG